MFYLLAFSEPTILSVSQALFWPTFTCIPNPRLRHPIVVDWAGAFWILQQHQFCTHTVNQLWPYPRVVRWFGACHWFSHVYNAHAKASRTVLWDITHLYWQFGEALRGVSIRFSTSFSTVFLSMWLAICPACCSVGMRFLLTMLNTLLTCQWSLTPDSVSYNLICYVIKWTLLDTWPHSVQIRFSLCVLKYSGANPHSHVCHSDTHTDNVDIICLIDKSG